MIKENKKLAIVVPVYNNWYYTNKLIKMILQLPNDHKLIIVDNGSNDETKNLKTSNFEVIKNDSNLGFAKACNQGFDLANKLGYQNVMFLNNDIKVYDKLNSWTEEIIRGSEQGFIVGPTIGCIDDNFQFICESGKFPTKGFGYMSGWCITASTSTWKKLILSGDIGPFSTKFFAYFEDTDLSFRARMIPIEFLIVKIPVRHIGRATGKIIGLQSAYINSKEIFMNLWNSSKK